MFLDSSSTTKYIDKDLDSQSLVVISVIDMMLVNKYNQFKFLRT